MTYAGKPPPPLLRLTLDLEHDVRDKAMQQLLRVFNAAMPRARA